MVCKLRYLLIVAAIYVMPLRAQVPDDVRRTIEQYLETLETSADYTQIYEDLTAFLDKPVNLNKAGTDELISFPLITPVQAVALTAHRQKYGPLINLSELQVIGFSPEQIRAIRPFVTLEAGAAAALNTLGNKLQQGRQEAILTVKRRYPDPEGSYLGDLLGSTLRLRYSLAGHYSFALTAEKDPGESWWRKGPDFYSGHAAVYNLGKIKTAVAGDYLLSMGQGLVLGSGIGIGKSANVLNIKRAQAALKPYRGVNEFLFLRGGAATLKLGKLDITAAAAVNALDTRLADTAIFGDLSFSSVDLDGLHRSNTEIAGKGNARRTMLGSWLSRTGRRGVWGGGVTRMSMNIPPEPPSQLYRRFYPTGTDQTFLHGWQGHTLGRWHLFSEYARLLETGQQALAAGALMSLGKWAELALHYRNYASGFISPYSTAFGNTSQNEKGFYTGIKINFSKRFSLNHYTDFWRQPWLTYRINAPSVNREMLWQLEYQPSKKTQLYLRMRQMQRPLGELSGQMKGVGRYDISMWRFHINAAVSEQSRLELRAENSLFTTGGNREQSSLYYAEYTGKFKGRMQVTARYTLFNISGYYNRIYAWENQLQYDFGTMAFYGKGRSAYLLLQKSLSRHLRAGLRYAWTESRDPDNTDPTWKRSIFAQLIWRK